MLHLIIPKKYLIKEDYEKINYTLKKIVLKSIRIDNKNKDEILV